MTRENIPDLLNIIHDGTNIGQACHRFETDRDGIIELLTLEIQRLNNNLVSCRRAAKRANTVIHTWNIEEHKRAELAEHELNHIIGVANDIDRKTWWE